MVSNFAYQKIFQIAAVVTFAALLKTVQIALKSIDRLFLLPERTAESAAVVNYIAPFGIRLTLVPIIIKAQGFLHMRNG